MGITAHKLLKGCPCLSRIVQVILINFSDGEQSIKAILAAGIFTSQEFVLLDSRVENLVVVEAPSHFHAQLGNCRSAGVCFRRCWRAQVNTTVGINYALVVLPVAIGGRTTIQGFAHALRCRELLTSPGFAVESTRLDRKGQEK